MNTALQTDLSNRLLADNLNLLVDFDFSFFESFFDSRRVDSAVSNKFFESNAGDFAADWVKAGKDNCFGRIVDNQINTG